MLGHTKSTNDEDNTATITVIYNDGTSDAMTSDHPNFARLDDITRNVPSAQQDEDEIRNLINLTQSVGERFRSLSERVSVNGHSVFFDGDVLNSTISDHILRLIEAGDDRGWRALVNFLEKLASNPSAESKASLYTYLDNRDFTILPDGNFLAYKGCQWDGDVPVSIHSGPGIVNGVSMNGYLSNAVGNVVEMQRSAVDADVFVGCSVGLHAGTYEYASGFGRGVLLRVSINPRDVVSVPQDCNFQKLRTCRYTVIEAEDKQYDAPTYSGGAYVAYSDYEDADEMGHEGGYSAGLADSSYDDEYYGDYPEDLTDEEVDDFRRAYAASYEVGYNDGEEERESEEEREEEERESEEEDDDYEDEEEDNDYDYVAPVWEPRKPVSGATAFPTLTNVSTEDTDAQTEADEEDAAEAQVVDEAHEEALELAEAHEEAQALNEDNSGEAKVLTVLEKIAEFLNEQY